MYQQANGPTVVVQPPPNNIYPINEKCVKGISVAILVLGCWCIILQITGIVYGIGLSEAAAGIWSGVWFVVVGSIGIAAARQKTKCLIVTFLVLSIISASLFAVAMLTLISIGLDEDEYDYDRACDYFYYYYYKSCSGAKAGLGINSLLLILSIVIGILSIVGSAFSCCACCCGSPVQVTPIPHSIPQAIVPTVAHGAGPTQVVVLVPSPTYPGHYTIASNHLLNNQTTVEQQPIRYDNAVSYGAYGPPQHTVDYPAVHQPTTVPAPPEETKTRLD